MRNFFTRSFLTVLAVASCLIFSGFIFSLTNSFASAQETLPVAAPNIPSAEGHGPPAGVQTGPTAEQIAAFEKEQGAPIDAFNAQSVEPPTIPEPGTVPDDVKKLVPEKELIDLYCAMTKWKSGDFFLAMDSLKKNLIPAIEAARVQGVDMTAPDIEVQKAEGTKRINAICAAKTIGEAEQLAKDFAQWGRDSSVASMQTQRGQMETQMKAMGDGIKEKVKSQLQPFIDAETAKIEPEIQAQAEAFAQEIVAGYPTGPGSTPPSESEITAQIEARLQPVIQAKQQEIEAKIKNKANELVAPEKKKIESIAALFENMDKKINADILAGAGKYAAQKKQALTLRRDLMVRMLTANMDEAKKQLDAQAEKIETARAANPALKSAAELKAELDQDQKDVVAKLAAALNADDEQALAQVMDDFRTKWEHVQDQAKQSASLPVTQMCAAATKQFADAKAQMQPGIQQLQDLQTRCAGSVEQECEAVNGIADRLSTISTKMNDMIKEMDLADSLCQSGTTDPTELVALFEKIQRDGEDAQAFGKALDADRSKVVANSVKTACDQVLPKLQAARVELKNNDLIVLKNNLDRCAGKTDPECAAINTISAKYTAFKTLVDQFLANVDQANTLCKTTKDKDFDKIISTLSELNQQGDDLQSQANDLKAEQAKNSPDEVKCRVSVEKMSSVRSLVADGLKQMSDTRAGLCGGNPNSVCDDIRKLTTAMTAVSVQAENVLSLATAVDNDCKKPYKATHAADISTHLANIETSAAGLQIKVDDLKKQADQLKQQGAGIWIEAESETDVYTVPLSSRPARNTKETAASWRPPYFGSGDWYLAAKGEWLSYPVTVKTAGTYNVWIRDYVDKFQARGIRKVSVEFDGKNYGTFPETTTQSPGDKGAFGWHKVGNGVTLTAGSHTLKVTKEATTAGAAILDAYYLTTGTDVPPEK